MQYAVEMHLLPVNPVASVRWTMPRALKTVDPRVAVNPGQARRLLTAVRGLDLRDPRPEVFFGAMYYAALRPEKAGTWARIGHSQPHNPAARRTHPHKTNRRRNGH